MLLSYLWFVLGDMKLYLVVLLLLVVGFAHSQPDGYSYVVNSLTKFQVYSFFFVFFFFSHSYSSTILFSSILFFFLLLLQLRPEMVVLV